MPQPNQPFPINYDRIRTALIQVMQKVTNLTAIVEEPETQNVPRPEKPYLSMKITGPAMKTGDDDKRVLPSGKTVSGGVRKMMVDFNCYGTSHEEAYNYMGLLQSALDLEDVQEALRRSGIAVWIIGNVADLSQLLNTGYEGRAHMDCSFGIASNVSSDLGTMESVEVTGTVNGTLNTDQTIPPA